MTVDFELNSRLVALLDNAEPAFAAAFIQRSPAGMYVMDHSGRIENANEVVAELLAIPLTELVGLNIWELLDLDVEDQLAALINDHDWTQPLITTLPFQRGDGGRVTLQVRSHPVLDEHGNVIHTISWASRVDADSDDSEAAANDLFRQATESSLVATAIIDQQGTLESINRAFSELVRQPVDELLGTNLQQFVPAEDREENDRLLHPVRSGEKDAVNFVARIYRSDGVELWVRKRVSLIPIANRQAPKLVVQLSDITEQHRAEILAQEALVDLAYRSTHDDLTGLLTRSEFINTLDRHLSGDELTRPAGLLFIDVDRFKAVNDGVSHLAGDRVLTAIAQQTVVALRPHDVVGRFGGDEFAAVLPDLSGPDEAFEIAEQLRNTIAGSDIAVESGMINTTVSIGVAISRPGSTGQEMLAEADAALHLAKQQGKDRCVLADEQMRHDIINRVELAQQIRSGLRSEQFQAWFQPIVDLSTGLIVSYEALARWVDGDVVRPARDFIDVAEENGLIQELGQRVIDEAVASVRLLEPQQTMSINASPTQVGTPQFSERLSWLLSSQSVDPSRVTIEITEQALLELSPVCRRGLESLRKSGVGIFVDDFGMGYSSLATLRDFPVTGIKLDRSFTALLDVDSADDTSARLAKGLADLAVNLDLIRIAEGVESPLQAHALAQMGWQAGQGWLYGEARPASELPLA